MFADLIRVQVEMDKMIEENRDCSVKCKKGCAKCCSENFGVSTVEFMYIMSQLLDKDKEKAIQVLQKGKELWLQYEKDFPEVAQMLKNNIETSSNFNEAIIELMKEQSIRKDQYIFPCVFLEETEGSCSVYADRPIVCRYHGVGRIEHWPEGVTIQFCEEVKEGVEINKVVDLTSLSDRIAELSKLEEKKSGMNLADRPYPMFYFCKIYADNLPNLMAKIAEYKSLSRQGVAEVRLARYLKRNGK